ncbi:MAG: choice-of-anchor D domain-containing protein, partial [Candidatus Marinimicrobia bacterium]|nr:choice-of-anchor D domain-containing protein [Candidatus Neomarinimicrobiota bacterium]
MKWFKHYKIAHVILLGWLVGSSVLRAQTNQFTPVEPTGLPYHVIIRNFNMTPTVSASVEIGLFTDTLCVGRIVTNSQNSNIDIVTWEGNPGYDLEGFTVGDTIRVQVATEIFDTLQVMDGLVIPVVGNGTFGDGTYSVIDGSVNLLEFPAIALPPEYENLSFGNVYVGESVTDTIRVDNNGSATLNAWFNSIPSGFLVEPQGFNLTPGSAQEIVITFAPWWARDYDENLYLQSNDPVASTVSIHLRGTGARSPQSNLMVEFDPQALRRIPADRPVETTLLLTNTGDDSLTIFGLESTHWIYTLPDTQFHLPPGGRYSTTVTAAGSEPGNYSGYIRIYHDSESQGNPVSYWLNSTVYLRHYIPVEPTGLPYSIVINRAQVDGHLLPNPSDIGVFAGDLCVGEFYNDGESVNLQLVAWEADSDLGLPGFTAGDSIEFRIHTSAYDSIITIEPEVTWLEGEGTFGAGAFSAVDLNGRSWLEPVSSVSATTLMYGLVSLQIGDTLSFTIENSGATALYLWNWNNSNTAFTPLSLPAIVPAGDSVEIPVWFHPSSAAWETGSLTFTTNDPNTPYQSIHFSGGGTVDGTATLRVDVPEIRFGDVPVGDTAAVALYLRNAGNAELQVTDIYFDAPNYWVSEDSLAIPPGNVRSVDVFWRPGSAGHFWSQVFISSNSSDDVNNSLNITGFGFDAYFEPVTPTGQSYQIIVSSLIDSAGLGFREGDEIGVFHENVCVGRGVYHPGNVNITAWQRDTQHGLPGFVAGDIMLFKYHSLTSDSNFTTVALDAVPTIIQGDGTFGSGPFAEIALTVLGESNPLQPYDGPVYWVSAVRGTDYLNNGQFSQPFRTIQHALNNTVSGDTIRVEPGTYMEKLAFKGHDVVLQSVAGADSTVISKPGDGPLLLVNQSESQATVIRGFTVSGGVINGNGAGIFIQNASPTLTDLIVENNQSLMGDGGGVYLFNSQTVMENCVVRNNSAVGNGGGVAITNASTASLQQTVVSNNSAEWGGGVFVGPAAGADFDHLLLIENEAMLGGGFYNTGNMTMTFTTIAQNSSSSYSGGLSEESILLSHSILFTNQDADVEFGFPESVSPDIAYSLVNLPEPGETNLNADPLFTDLAGGDYHLNPASPAIDTGNSELDFQAEPEPNGDRPNLGYYGATTEATVAELRTPLPAQLDAVEDSLFSFALLFTPDSNVVFQADYIDGPGWLEFAPENLLLSGTPDNQHVGMAPVTVHSWDNYGRRDTVTVPLVVTNINDPPIIQSLPDTQLTQDIAWNYAVEVNDPDLDDSLRYVVDEMPPGMVFDSSLIRFDWMPLNEDVGQHVLAISVTDDSGAVAVQTDTLTVENVNDPPELVEVPEPLTMPEGAADTLFVLSPLFRDVDQLVVYDSLSYSVSGFDTTLVQVTLLHDSLRIQP